MGGLDVVCYTHIDGRHRHTGRCRQSIRGVVQGPASGLAICRDADGFLLFGCDGRWEAVTDTWHETIEDALRQAEFEYEGVSQSWVYPKA